MKQHVSSCLSPNVPLISSVKTTSRVSKLANRRTELVVCNIQSDCLQWPKGNIRQRIIQFDVYETFMINITAKTSHISILLSKSDILPKDKQCGSVPGLQKLPDPITRDQMCQQNGYLVDAECQSAAITYGPDEPSIDCDRYMLVSQPQHSLQGV